MRSYALLVAGAVALANAQSSVSGVPEIPTPTGGDPAATSAAAKINECLKECDGADLTCQAACVSVPAPNDDQANENTKCAEECDQGDGSPEDTEKFGECLAKCAEEHYFDGEETPDSSGSSSSGSNNNDDDEDEADATTTDSETQTESQTETETETETSTESGSSDDDEATTTGSSDDSESTDGADSEESDEGDAEEDSAASGLFVGTAASFFGLFAAFFL